MKKTTAEIQKVLEGLKKQKAAAESNGNTLNPLDRITIQIEMLEGRKRYSDYSSDDDQYTDSIAYETGEWLNGEYCDDDNELFFNE